MLHHYGIVLNKRGDSEQAVDFMLRSLRLLETQDAVHLNVGRIFFNDRQLKQAHVHISRAIELNPGRSEAEVMLGRCLVAEGRHCEATEAFLRAFDARPDDFTLLIRLADSTDKSGDTTAAIEWYRYILDRDPMNVVARKTLGLVLRRSNRADEAAHELEQGVQLVPGDLELQHNLAAQYEEMGRFDDAVEGYRAVLRQDSDNAMALGSLVRLPGVADAGELADRAAATSSSELPQFERVFISYALGKYHSRTGEHDQAFRWFKAANDLQASTFPYPGKRLEDFVSTTCSTFNNELIERNTAQRWLDRKLLFIVGMPRSGTTLVEQILSSHSAVFGGGEIGCLVGHFGLGTDDWPSTDEHGRRLDRWSSSRLSKARDAYSAVIDSFDTDRHFVTDKMPFNFLHLGIIRMLFPEARIIHCRRNVLDNALSCYMENLTPGFSFATEFHRFAHYYASYERLMTHWQTLRSKSILTVQYEDLVEELEGHVRSILKFCGLPWEDQCLDFFATPRAISTPSNWQVRQPIYKTSIGRWRNYEPWLGPLLEALAHHGVSTDYDRHGSPDLHQGTVS